MDYIKLAQRTIVMLSSMIESGECHTTRSKEMKDNALNGLEQLRIHDVSGRSEQCNHKFERIEKGGEFQGNQCDCGEWEDLT